ncbi:MAG: hypothetical protein PHN75_17615 [Syntrophales bacterium]|nr:hypothetical protein [Syntrophales bacterium]
MDAKNSQLMQLVNMDDPGDVLEEAKTIVLKMFTEFNFSHLDTAFFSIESLFAGRYSGYRSCNTSYHDLFHTTDVLMAMARLIHGAYIDGIRFTEEEVNLGLISALMHDAGYIQTMEDATGTGAKYTLNHINRSIQFTYGLYGNHPYFYRHLEDFSDILKCTGLSIRIKEIQFTTYPIEMLGKMLGTADLLGQMAGRNYLKKLLYLYAEFVEGGVDGFDSELDLLEKTAGFHETTQIRFVNELGCVNRFARLHFRERWHVDRDLYLESIELNINHLKWILENHVSDYRDYLTKTGE